MASIVEQQLAILRLMRDATHSGTITWRQSEEDANWFYTETGPIESYIHFKSPAYLGTEGSDRDFVDVGDAGRFMVGTEGWMLALEILAAGFDDWNEHLQGLAVQYADRIAVLRRVLGNGDS